MRFTRRSKIEAQHELIQLLLKHPEGLRTSELRGTSKFHGERTLSNRQIINLLRPLNLVTAHVGRQGMRTYLLWRVNELARKNRTVAPA